MYLAAFANGHVQSERTGSVGEHCLEHWAAFSFGAPAAGNLREPGLSNLRRMAPRGKGNKPNNQIESTIMSKRTCTRNTVYDKVEDK